MERIRYRLLLNDVVPPSNLNSPFITHESCNWNVAIYFFRSVTPKKQNSQNMVNLLHRWDSFELLQKLVFCFLPLN